MILNPDKLEKSFIKIFAIEFSILAVIIVLLILL